MKFTEVELSRVDDLIADPAWAFEQKFDGTRGLAVITEKGVWWPGGGGVGSLKHTAAIQHFAKLNPSLMGYLDPDEGEEFVLDGEIIVGTGEYHIWDIAYARVTRLSYDGSAEDLVTPDMPFCSRRGVLEDLFGGEQSKQWWPAGVRLVRQASDPEQKRLLWEAVRDGGGEGVMAKRLDSPYESGVRVKHSLKLKFVKTADVVIMAVNRPDPKHGNFTLGAFNDEGVLTLIGGCSAIGKDTATKVGDVIEIAYLYWTGGSPYQPRMLHIRDDKAPGDCTFSQFPAYSREAR